MTDGPYLDRKSKQVVSDQSSVSFQSHNRSTHQSGIPVVTHQVPRCNHMDFAIPPVHAVQAPDENVDT